MNILDENLPKNQTALLESWRIHTKQIGVSVGRSGMSDEDLIPLLLRQHFPTLFTRDKGFYNRKLCHEGYCLVILAVGKDESASFVRRFLRHTDFDTRSKRMGKVVRVSRAKVSFLSLSERREMTSEWFKIA